MRPPARVSPANGYRAVPRRRTESGADAGTVTVSDSPTDDPPALTPLDARPEPGSDTPNLDDAAFKAGDAAPDA